MKLEQLQTLQRELDKEFQIENIQSSVYYFFENKWHTLKTKIPVDTGTSFNLEKSRSESISHHAPSSLTAWFYFSDSDCTVSLTSPKSPQIATRKRYRERIVKVKEGAKNAYRVSHHSLTHLLAKDAFREALNDALSEVGKETASDQEAQESGLPRKLALLAFDIDYFKQVNDTWGHLYGDQVLKTFGMRLEGTAERIRTANSGAPFVQIGHPSGEEFLVLIMANATREQFAQWSNEFRTHISDEILPSEKEWQWLKSRDDISVIVPPPVPERAITTSVGVAMHTNLSSLDPTVDPSSVLLDCADTALYRAKAAGKNQVIFFDEILSSCGRVLEQDIGTRVVAIDIGSNVGVSMGQEFKVFPQTFTGKKKFSVNDGRTTRTLGNYPRVENARIIVFNVQPEISFAFISPPDDNTISLEAGDHLEAIPAGSIGHLLPNSSKYFPASADSLRSGGIQALQEFVKSSGDAGPFAIVVRFSREAEYLRKYGTAALNIALAKLYREAQGTFHAARFVEVLDRGSVCIVGPKTAYKEKIVVDFANGIASEFPELGVLAGIFCEADQVTSLRNDEIELNAGNAIEFARFAASELGISPDTRIRHFNDATARKVLQAARESQSFEVAYADFERLRGLGVETAPLANLGGLIASSLGRHKQALEHFETAMNKDQNNLVFKSNYGTAAYLLGETESALNVLNALSKDEVNKLETLHPWGYVVYARLLARAKISGSSAFDAARFAHIAPIALGLPDSQDSSESQVIRDMLLHFDVEPQESNK